MRPWAVVSAVAVVEYSGQGESVLQLPSEVAKEECSALGHVPLPDGSWMVLSQEHRMEARVAPLVDPAIQ